MDDLTRAQAAVRAILADLAGDDWTGATPCPDWDLARGAGRRLEVDEAVAERAITHSLALLERLPSGRTPHPTEDARRARASAGTPKRPFAPSRPVADEAPAIDRLVALLGRDPDRRLSG